MFHIFKIKFNKAKRIARCLKQYQPSYTIYYGNQLPFLDVMIIKEGKKVFMDIYSKPTDSKRYVSFTSNHPKHWLKNVPFSLALRICMIAEKDSLKEIKLKELETLLLEQHYPERIIKAGINKALKIPQNELRKVKEQEEKKILPFFIYLFAFFKVIV